MSLRVKSFVTIQMKATDQYFPVVLFIILYKVVLTFESVNEILKCDHSNEKLLNSTFLWYCLLCCTKVVLIFESMDEILKCDYSDESY